MNRHVPVPPSRPRRSHLDAELRLRSDGKPLDTRLVSTTCEPPCSSSMSERKREREKERKREAREREKESSSEQVPGEMANRVEFIMAPEEIALEHREIDNVAGFFVELERVDDGASSKRQDFEVE